MYGWISAKYSLDLMIPEDDVTKISSLVSKVRTVIFLDCEIQILKKLACKKLIGVIFSWILKPAMKL